jgi:hypothetical protein
VVPVDAVHGEAVLTDLLQLVDAPVAKEEQELGLVTGFAEADEHPSHVT